MIKIHFLAASCLLVFFVGCSTPDINTRGPSSITTSEDLKVLKQRKIELGTLSMHFQNRKNASQLEQIQNEQKRIDKKIAELNKIL